MPENVLKDLLKGSDRLITYSAPMELRIADTDRIDGKPKTLWRMPMTGEIVEPGTRGAVEYRRWWATISTEQRRQYKEIIERNAVVAAFLQWMDDGGGNVRYMHYLQPVGRIFKDDYEIRDSGVFAGFSIPVRETKAIQQIEDGLIRCVSIGFNPDWRIDEPVVWEPDGTVRWKAISILEISIGDYGATPGTEFIEERTAQTETLFDRLKRHQTNLAAMIKRLSPGGAAPENQRSSTMEETFHMDEAKLKEILSGALTPLNERLNQMEQKLAAAAQPPTPKPETPAQVQTPAPATPPQETELEKRFAKLETSIGTLVGSLEKLGTGTTGQQTGQTLEQRVAAFEEAVKKVDTPDHNAPLSFIKCDDGQALTMERLAGDFRRA